MWRKTRTKATCGTFEENREVAGTEELSKGHTLQDLVNICDFIVFYSDRKLNF